MINDLHIASFVIWNNVKPQPVVPLSRQGFMVSDLIYPVIIRRVCLVISFEDKLQSTLGIDDFWCWRQRKVKMNPSASGRIGNRRKVRFARCRRRSPYFAQIVVGKNEKIFDVRRLRARRRFWSGSPGRRKIIQWIVSIAGKLIKRSLSWLNISNFKMQVRAITSRSTNFTNLIVSRDMGSNIWKLRWVAVVFHQM